LPKFLIAAMIDLHRLNGTPFVLNADLIETIEATPDTVVVLVTGRRFVVRESVPEVVDRVLTYKRQAGFSVIPLPQAEKE
jgi:flagellar protein FlbD